MLDPLPIILKAGSLSLRELSARVGDGLEAWLATQLKNGVVRIEAAEDKPDLRDLHTILGHSEEAIAAHLAAMAQSPIGDSVEISPTAKTWRNPFAAA
jgi:hypothetical protein